MSYTIDTHNFEVYKLGDSILASYPFIVSDVRYTCWFTELTAPVESVEQTVEEIEDEGTFDAGPGTFKVDFDLEERFQSGDEDLLFVIPEGGYRNTITNLRHITDAIGEIIEIHQKAYNCVFYFAEPATRGHDVLYKRNIIPMLSKVGYSYYVVDENAQEGNSYIFLKELSVGVDDDLQ
ncbi:hypothetical protein AB4510_01300 [Vibrio sp. 10N.222.54.B12]|uniref:hypothetical protein n=1 Tax=Vibrio sp. 10N.222.54.B12 TaxID=3229636 RepID=UPI00354B2A3E